MAKESFVIKKNRLVRNATKRIKQILDTEYKKTIQKATIISLKLFKGQT